MTIVQFRKKTGDTKELIREAKELHAITKAAGVPLLINDRVDVAIAVGCEGVHIGQDDIGNTLFSLKQVSLSTCLISILFPNEMNRKPETSQNSDRQKFIDTDLI